MNWEKIQKLYPVNDELIWLNNCGTTPINQNTIQDLNQYLVGYAKKGVLSDVKKYPQVKFAIQKIISKLLNAKINEIGVIHHTNEGMNFISMGFDLKKGDEILLLENEYPSNIYPWEHWKEKGVEIRFCPMAITPDKFLSNFQHSITTKTRVVSLSAVHWCTGMPLPLKQIGEICENKNIEFVLDGAQGVGMIPIDVKSMKISYMAFPAWKWLLGPLGLGVLYIQENKISKLKFPFKGTGSVVNDENYLPYREELKPGVDRYEISTNNFLDWVYFLSTLEMLEEIQFDTVQARIYELASYLTTKLKQIGFEAHSKHFPELKTGIVVVEKPGVDPEKINKYLREKGVVSAVRLGRIRFSPHIYNSENHLDRLVEFMNEFT